MTPPHEPKLMRPDWRERTATHRRSPTSDIAGRQPWDCAHLVWYSPGATLGWHRDKPPGFRWLSGMRLFDGDDIHGTFCVSVTDDGVPLIWAFGSTTEAEEHDGDGAYPDLYNFGTEAAALVGVLAAAPRLE